MIEYLSDECKKGLVSELSHTLNGYESAFANTPDYVLAEYLMACLESYQKSIWLLRYHERPAECIDMSLDEYKILLQKTYLIGTTCLEGTLL